jgi:hypothetical protein
MYIQRQVLSIMMRAAPQRAGPERRREKYLSLEFKRIDKVLVMAGRRMTCYLKVTSLINIH